MKKSVLFLGISAALIASATQADRMNIDLQFDDEGKASPEVSYPYNWNGNWFSQVRYRSVSITDTDTSQALKRSSTTVEEQFKGVDLIGYQQKQDGFSWALIGGFEVIDIERTEFGFGTIGSQAIGIDNSVDISSQRMMITGDIGYETGRYAVRGSVMLSPFGSLDVTQKTDIDYTNSLSEEVDSSTGQNFSYGVKLDGEIKTSLGVDFGFGAEYSYLPLKYDIAQANSDLTGFVTSEIEQNETTTRYSARIILPEQDGMGRPVIGLTQETLSTEVDGDTSDETISYLVLGLDKRF